MKKEARDLEACDAMRGGLRHVARRRHVQYQSAATAVLDGTDEWWTLDSTCLTTYSYVHGIGQTRRNTKIARGYSLKVTAPFSFSCHKRLKHVWSAQATQTPYDCTLRRPTNQQRPALQVNRPPPPSLLILTPRYNHIHTTNKLLEQHRLMHIGNEES